MGQIAAAGQTAGHMWAEMAKTDGVAGLKDQVTDRLTAAQARLGHIWTEINKTEEDVDTESEEGETDASKVSAQTKPSCSSDSILSCFGQPTC